MLETKNIRDYEMLSCGGWHEIRRKGETQGQWIAMNKAVEVKP